MSHKYLENVHVSRTSREHVAKFLNRFQKICKCFRQNISQDCRATVVIMKMKISHIRGKVVRHSPECLATVVRQSRGIFSKLDRNSRIYRINVHSMRMQRKSCVCLIVNLCRKIVENYSRTSLQLSHTSEVGVFS